MSILDKPSIADEVRAIKLKRLERKERRALMKRMGKAVKPTRRKKVKLPKNLAKEYAERAAFFRTL